MEKMKMESPNITSQNVDAIATLFPNCITETKDEHGNLKKAINFDVLQQLLSEDIIKGNEAYEFTWVGKKDSILEANRPTRKTLRPCPEESVDWDTTENLYIEGDNLEVLKLLQESYLGKVKMIYIDPPYNTGHDFIYQDNFIQATDEYEDISDQYDIEKNRLVSNPSTNGRFHSNWCNMIYPRLLLARNLLADNGIIFISIDDNEQSDLKKICDEIFNANNFIGCLSVENNPKGRKNSAFVSVSSEYCMIYAKNKAASYFIENIPKKASDMTMDENGRFVHNSGKRVLVGENDFNSPVTNVDSEKNYSVYYNQINENIVIKREKYGEEDKDLLATGYIKYYSHNNENLVENTYTIAKFRELFEKHALDFTESKIYEKNFSDTIRIKSLLVNREYDAIVNGTPKKYRIDLTTTGAGTYLKSLFQLRNLPFEAPKSVGLLKLLISLLDAKDFIVLDFFSGSSTTADAVIQLNAEDGGNRKFIMVQLPEICDENSEAYKAGFHNICEIGKERIRRVGNKIIETNHLTTANLDTGFRVFKLDGSNMENVYYSADEYNQQMLTGLESNIKPDRSALDLLFGCLLEWGLPLSMSYSSEQIDGCTVHTYNGDDLIACFDKNIPVSVITEIAKRQPLRAVFRDAGFADSPEKINVWERFKSLSPDTRVKVI